MKHLLSFYQEHAEQVLLPFWLKAIDLERGGVYTCFNNEGTELVSTDKYTWSQGRFIWILAQTASMIDNKLLTGDAEFCMRNARKNVDFLKNHVFLDNGNCAYVLTEDGGKKEAIPGLGYDISFYADCFVVLGFAKFAHGSRDAEVLQDALQLYRRIVERLAQGNVRSEPYPVPVGYEAHSVPMIMLNVAQELADALDSFSHPEAQAVRDEAESYMNTIMDRFYTGSGIIREMLPMDVGETDTLLTRHVTPGHSLESMWFVMNEALKIGNQQRVDQAAAVIEQAFELGWDPEYGGLLRYVDREGGEVRGRRTGGRYEQLVGDTWDMKIWWPHSEALYALLLAYKQTGEPHFYAKYEQMHDYVFRTFPHPDAGIGEWIQIRDRSGQPVQKTVALPVKDPYHILRNVLLTIELLAEQ
ncbi:AGE family epimerase/isomerase [Paenibacillus periandrae]|uniref:AGE family epimerase/isomerase n=1 Tax=Paenibacillus periandrae TaxID=1761741 RepID=UPI001F094E69|nr:AGE family epimerase/isomerase [Paenibacillus periandrae]